jgi:hypothetical protein
MNTYQQPPDFKSGKVLAICQRHKVSIIRIIEPLNDRNFRPDLPLDLLVEFANPRVTSSDLILVKNDLTAALGRPVKIQNLEEMTRHARFEAMSGSKIVYA